MKPCSINGCEKAVLARGWCSTHYSRWNKHGDPLTSMSTPHGAPLAFIEYAKAHTGEECLQWPFARNSNGYGHLYLEDGTGISAAKYMCMVVHGDPPSLAHETAHSCGKGHLACINPNHLRWATHVENLRDKVVHGTHLQGEKHGASKLTSREVVEIVRLSSEGKTQRAVAAQFGVSKGTVQSIQEGRSWSHLTGIQL